MMTGGNWGPPWEPWQDILDRLKDVDARLVIQDGPRISQARKLIVELDSALPDADLNSSDHRLTQDYLSAATSFCDSYLEPTDADERSVAAPLKLPSDSRALLRAYGKLHSRYLGLRTKLNRSLKEKKAESYHA